jgi:hypothetical protein
MKKLLVLIAVLMLVMAACGGADEPATGDLPTNTGDSPAAGSTCLEGEPDCQDIPGNAEPQDLPGSDDSVDSGGMVIDGGLTVAEALATDATGTIAVQGYVVATGDEVRLCDALAASYPPQCGGDSVLLDGLDAIDPDELTSEGNVRWTDVPQTVLGELSDGVLNTTTMSQ